MKQFLSCDWGTSTFRLRLINADDLTVIAEETIDMGIGSAYKRWQQQKDLSRGDFYLSIIQEQIKSLSKKLNLALDKIPVILSGMASSTIGMIDLPYKELPFEMDGSNLLVKKMKYKDCPNAFIVISGAKTDDDIMRGEETKIVGCSSLLDDITGEQILILPGTHPKHVVIKDHKAVSFQTYMTGEFFGLLSRQSILSSSVEKGGDFYDIANQESFATGVKAGVTSNLLHEAFIIRTNHVLKDSSKQRNFYYLSGLLIGAELKDIQPGLKITLVGNSTQIIYYAAACNLLGVKVKQEIDADFALIWGQRTILSFFPQ